MDQASHSLQGLKDAIAVAEGNFSFVCEDISADAHIKNSSTIKIERLGREKFLPPSAEVNSTAAGCSYLNASATTIVEEIPYASSDEIFEGICSSQREGALYQMPILGPNNLTVLLIVVFVLASFTLVFGVRSSFYEQAVEQVAIQVSDFPLEKLVDRILLNESQGEPTARNKRSSAMGAGQFLDGTWLELIRAHRSDLLAGRTEKEVLSLRSNHGLSREMAIRFLERNAAVLAKRGLPVTPISLYLAHFAGPAGAAAILTSPGDADAATVIANADARAEVTRMKIINSNPFLEGFTVEGLKNWADFKMRGLASR